MTETADETMSRDEELLHAYHDGELKGLARRRFERQLRQSPELREDLGALDVLGHAVREIDAEGVSPDLWDEIALRLPAVDARRGEGDLTRGGGLRRWGLHPIGASLAVAAAAVAVAVMVMWPQPQLRASVVQWIDGGGNNVMVLDQEPDTTIIWILDGAIEEVSMGGGSEVV